VATVTAGQSGLSLAPPVLSYHPAPAWCAGGVGGSAKSGQLGRRRAWRLTDGDSAGCRADQRWMPGSVSSGNL